MGAALSCWTRVLTNKARVLMVGLDGAGKTTILYQLKMGKVVSTISTYGYHEETVSSIKGVTFNLWDVGGHRDIRSLWHHYLHDIQGLIFVVDSTDSARMTECRQELHNLVSHDEASYIPLLVFANKQDLPGALAVSDVGEALGMMELSMADRPWHIQGTDALSGEGLYSGMRMLAKFVKQVKKNKPLTRKRKDKKEKYKMK